MADYGRKLYIGDEPYTVKMKKVTGAHMRNEQVNRMGRDVVNQGDRKKPYRMGSYQEMINGPAITAVNFPLSQHKR